jgi:hypothetical protein
MDVLQALALHIQLLSQAWVSISERGAGIKSLLLCYQTRAKLMQLHAFGAFTLPRGRYRCEYLKRLGSCPPDGR